MRGFPHPGGPRGRRAGHAHGGGAHEGAGEASGSLAPPDSGGGRVRGWHPGPALAQRGAPGGGPGVGGRGGVGRLSSVLGVLLGETTTIGVRGHRVTRWMADREIKEVVTRFGTLRVKCAWLGGKLVNVAPEYEDCKAAAASSGVPLKVVMAEAVRACVEEWDQPAS
ncbi:MAG: nickel insertion protein [Bacillota bacterium]